MQLSVEVVALVVKFQDLGVFDQKTECPAHQFWVMANEIVQNLAVIFREAEEEVLHTRLWWWASKREVLHGLGERSVLEGGVLANDHERFDEWQQNSRNIKHAVGQADST